MSSVLRLVSPKPPRLSAALARSRRLGIRQAHTPRPLPYSVEEGLGKFLPPQALQTLVEYQDGLLERFNHELRTDSRAELHNTVAQMVLKYAEQKDRTLAFNYGVLALNNSFFLDNLKPPPPKGFEYTTHQGEVSPILLEKIRQSYGDFPRLKSTFSAAALGMFTNGWVWLVTDRKGNLGILPTFGPSTLLIRSRQNVGLGPDGKIQFREVVPFTSETPQVSGSPSQNTIPPGVGPSSPISGLSSGLRGLPGYPPLDPHARSYSNTLGKDILHPTSMLDDNMQDDKLTQKIFTVGNALYPLFCIPTYEHAWMSAGFGVWGKEDWLKEYWTVLDWQKVSRIYDEVMKLPK